jgi:hypothetical protein
LLGFFCISQEVRLVIMKSRLDNAASLQNLFVDRGRDEGLTPPLPMNLSRQNQPNFMQVWVWKPV